ncbi:hypothetical protein [Arcobacter arenosus]|uniref:Uncharacterized protein n=1 Tax=Arcobacter arenosus TaxID=2576037 RepID=A0A5R8XWW4_9BACT|nr:hypothetical protein [Arcobacter arenosus]TLP35499.1 hypothetical protein FDK22_14705 [Arcobacter arenosus]
MSHDINKIIINDEDKALKELLKSDEKTDISLLLTLLMDNDSFKCIDLILQKYPHKIDKTLAVELMKKFKLDIYSLDEIIENEDKKSFERLILIELIDKEKIREDKTDFSKTVYGF